MPLQAFINKTQMDAILTWYFKNFLNKTVQTITYSAYNNDFNRATVNCVDTEAPTPTRTVEQIKQATKPGSIVID